MTARWNITVALWAAIALFTFGHSASRPQVCWVVESRPPRYADCTTSQIALTASFAALFWPLYWSWELQE